MSSLKLYAPQECEVHSYAADGFDDSPNFETCDTVEREVVSFAGFEHGRNVSLMEILARTRAVYRNKRCRDCGRPTVQPVERDDALLGKNRLPIPGSATLLGFTCQYCRNEWSL